MSRGCHPSLYKSGEYHIVFEDPEGNKVSGLVDAE